MAETEHISAIRFDDGDVVTERRYDAGMLLKPIKRQSDGAILAQGICVREGVLLYRRADGSIRRELVTREAVLDTARTIARATLTLHHPGDGFVTPENFEKHGVGDIDGTVEVEEDAQGAFAKIKVAIRRKDAIKAFDEDGVRELSPGYKVIMDESAGVHEIHGRYDARQVGREVNHGALVPRGRGGPSVGLRADSTDAVQIESITPTQITAQPAKRGDTMDPKIVALLAALGVTHLDNLDAACAEGNQRIASLRTAASTRSDAEFSKLEAEKKKAEEDAEEEKKKAEDMKAEDEKEKGRADAVEAALTTIKADAKAREDAKALGLLQAVAEKVKVNHDGLDLPALRLAVAKTRIDSLDPETPAAYLDGVLAMIEKEIATPKRSRWDMSGDPKKREDAESEKDSHFSPMLDRADAARAGGDA